MMLSDGCCNFSILKQFWTFPQGQWVDKMSVCEANSSIIPDKFKFLFC